MEWEHKAEGQVHRRQRAGGVRRPRAAGRGGLSSAERLVAWEAGGTSVGTQAGQESGLRNSAGLSLW